MGETNQKIETKWTWAQLQTELQQGLTHRYTKCQNTTKNQEHANNNLKIRGTKDQQDQMRHERSKRHARQKRLRAQDSRLLRTKNSMLFTNKFMAWAQVLNIQEQTNGRTICANVHASNTNPSPKTMRKIKHIRLNKKQMANAVNKKQQTHLGIYANKPEFAKHMRKILVCRDTGTQKIKIKHQPNRARKSKHGMIGKYAPMRKTRKSIRRSKHDANMGMR